MRTQPWTKVDDAELTKAIEKALTQKGLVVSKAQVAKILQFHEASKSKKTI